MKVFVSLKLFATLKNYRPDSAERFPIALIFTVRVLARTAGDSPAGFLVHPVYVEGTSSSHFFLDNSHRLY